MVRELKFHEKKLLKRVDFINWKHDKNFHEVMLMRKFMIQKREDYIFYNKLVGKIAKLTNMLKGLDKNDQFRIKLTDQLLNKLYAMGIIQTKNSLLACDQIKASDFCKRRLPVVMKRLQMGQHLKDCVTFVEQGHVRVGPEVVTDPSFLVSRNLEDFVTWVDNSKVRRHVLKYREQVDDFDLM